MLVIDTSAMIEILKRTDRGIDLFLRLEEEEVHAPHLIDVEVTQVLRRLVLKKEMTLSEADGAFEIFGDIPIERHPHTPFLPQIWSMRHNVSAYDASYVALSIALGAELLTLDEGLRQAAARHIH